MSSTATTRTSACGSSEGSGKGPLQPEELKIMREIVEARPLLTRCLHGRHDPLISGNGSGAGLARRRLGDDNDGWITQRTSSKRELVRMELRKRETLYGEFISECSRLAIDALAHGSDKPETMLVRLCIAQPHPTFGVCRGARGGGKRLRRMADNISRPTCRSKRFARSRDPWRRIRSSRSVRRAAPNLNRSAPG